MDKSVEKDGVAATVIELDQTPRRNVRRKLVQSTLFPHQSEDVIEVNADQTCDTEEGEGGDGDFCNSSQGKKTRKRKEKTPNNGASKKLGKGKSPRKSTPKKSATKNGIDQTNAVNVSPPVPNLRLEAKLRAEEDSRMSAGKQIHPFFSSWKGGKRNQEAAAAENGQSKGKGRDTIVTIGPIHVFERFEDGYRTIDWKNWTFCEQTSTTWSPDQQIKLKSLEARPKEFDLNELPSLSLPDVCVIDDEEPEKCASQSEGITEAFPVVLIADQVEKRGFLGSLDGAEQDCEVFEAINLSDDDGNVADIIHEPQTISCRESNDFNGQPRNSLWVDKYQPRSASEVCGNTESVKVMNEWLCLWHERGFQPSKDFLSSDEEKSQDADYNCSESDSDSENSGAEDYLKNVLLIVGPAGSGKSAAVHACAKEQGFKILESNASECRSGAVVRQKFGEALKSYSLSRSLDPLFSSCTDSNGVDDVIEVAPVLHIQNDRANLKPLILFEDVDICFAEDRGLVSAIQQIAEKAKGPVVLTANDKNHGLPDNLKRIELCFSLSSKEELLRHLSLVCAAEEIKVNPGSLEQLTMISGGDIRKAIMQLQFWFQSKPKRAREAKNTGDPDLFDHEAGHMLLPRIIARDFPSQLSQLVESEIAKVLSMEEESYNTVDVFVEEVENEKMLNRIWRRGTEKNSIQAKKAAMLRQKNCFEDYDELEDVLSIPCEPSNTSYQQLSFSRPNRRRKLNVVMSSDSEDEPLADIPVSVSRDQEDDRLVLQENGTLSSYWPDMQKEIVVPSVASGEEILEASCYQFETSKVSCIQVSQSIDVSCVPESSYVPETLMDGEAELSPRAVSCGHFDGRVEVSMNEDVVQSSPTNEIYIEKFQVLDCVKYTCEIIAESSDATVMEDCFKEYVGTTQKMQQVSDECSRIDFGKTFKTAQKSKLDTSRYTVQESWKKLCLSEADFKPYLDSEPVEAPQVLDLTHQITNLISEADLTHSRCLNLGALEPMMNASGDLDTSGLSQMLEQMTSTVAQQGFSFFTNQIATTDSVPTSSATMVAGRGVVIDETGGQDYASSCGSCLDMKPETHNDLLKCERMVRLSEILESVVPPRSLKGRAFHEYASFIGRISRADPSNLSGAMEKSRRRRSREARHYLSMELSLEDIAFLGQHSTYSRNE
ncbi:Replication factor C subunit 1 [Cardamine amara subsp. amara]|uniref:Replication factor C subunit 1 n=1 Tax=Cardamine amara subsp. amara TaxID=228776 RepID=A0ABD1BII9_CARAN